MALKKTFEAENSREQCEQQQWKLMRESATKIILRYIIDDMEICICYYLWVSECTNLVIKNTVLFYSYYCKRKILWKSEFSVGQKHALRTFTNLRIQYSVGTLERYFIHNQVKDCRHKQFGTGQYVGVNNVCLERWV